MNIQWYPGHMTKAKRMMQENIKLIDIVIELVDARIPFSSKNPDIDELAKNKYRLILLNKVDLADDSVTSKWEEYYREKGFYVAKINARSGNGMKGIDSIVQEACKEKIERDRKRGIINRPIRAMIVGIPNVGKSTFINSYAKKACTKVGNKPGVTKGKQWIRLGKNIELLDTPGILWPKFDDEAVGLKLSYIGSINDEILNITDIACELIKFIHNNYCNIIAERYKIEESDDAVAMLSDIAEKRACVKKGGELDIDKAAALLLDDFRAGKLGRISLELPNRK
ncbi:MAG: ribosome biogenesis GTPase YlqF [Coprococcus sp.]